MVPVAFELNALLQVLVGLHRELFGGQHSIPHPVLRAAAHIDIIIHYHNIRIEANLDSHCIISDVINGRPTCIF